MRQALDRVLATSLPPLSAALGVYFLGLAASRLVVGGRPAVILAPLAGVSGVLLLALRLALRRFLPREGRAHAWGMGIAMLVLANCLAHIALTGEMRHTTSLIVLLLGAGFLLVSDAWFVATAGITAAGWLAVTLSLPRPTAPLHYALAMLEAIVVAGIVHHVRVRTLVRLEEERAALQAELEARSRAEERQRALLQAVPDLFFRMRRDGTFLDVQAGAPADLLIPVEQFIGKRLAEVPLPAELRERTLAAVERALEGGGLQELEYTLPLPDVERAFEARVVRSGLDEVVIISRNVSARHAAEASLRDSEARYRALFDATPLPVWVFDVETLAFLAVNEAALRRYGYTRAEFLGGLTLEQINAPEHAAEVRAVPHRELPLFDQSGPWTHITKQGAPLEVEVSTHALVFGGRRARCVVVQDVTERRRVERFKDHLVGIAAHELRSPLSAIRAALERLAESGALTAAERQVLQISERSAERMARLIDDLLDLDKAEAGELTLAREPVSLGDVLGEALGVCAQRSGQLGVALRLAEAPRGAVIGDRERLTQVVTNLVANALAFSPPGDAVLVSAREFGSRFRVEVADRGPGVPEAFRPRLFQRFAQAPAHARSRKGSGLGLAISRGIIEALGGRIGYEPRAGGGSTFYFELPAAMAPAPVPPQA